MDDKPTSPAPLPPDLASLALAITEHAPLPMATVEGATHLVRYCNPAFCHLMGKPLAQLVGKPLDELLPAQDACMTLIERVLRTSRPESYIEQDPTKPHPVFWSYTIWPVKEDKGLVGIMIQVTETAEVHGKTVAMNQALILGSVRQHELTEAAESLNEQLRAEIAERKKVEEALREADQALKEADRRKDEFMATLAHELRNPLAPIKNLLDVAAHANGSTTVIKDARLRIQRQIAKMVQLVDDLMDISRINSGKIVLRKSRADVRVVLDDVLDGTRAVTEYFGRNIIVNLPEEPVYLNADPVRLGQIIGNLINNACKYTDPNGTVAITVQREGDSALIRVADTGIGIAPDMLPHIFEMFTQIDYSLERTRGGLGLGLAIVKQLVELHGGTVRVASAGLGQGTEFIVRLPLAAADLPATATPETPDITKAGFALKIVVADDNVDSADSMAMLLQLDGHDVRAAYDGRDAIEVAEKFRPDVMLLDIGMPRLNGYDTAREIRKTEWGRETILIALTGWGLEKNKREALAAGFNHHLVKPVDIDEIRRLFSSIAPASARRLATHT